MGSKYRLAPRLAEVFATLPPGPAIDAFSGSGVVAYTLKASGRAVLANDHLTFTSTLAEALVANEGEQLTPEDVERICSPSRDGRDFIARTFDGLYFPRADHAFLDAAWSHVDELSGPKRALALSALCLAAAQKQPRGVFTVTTPRYDDGRRQFRMSLEALFREAVDRCNAAVIPGAARARCGDVFDLDEPAAIAYLDPPYAPPRDDTCYVKRYHFLEGWRRTGAGRRSCGRRGRASCASGTRRSAPSAPPVRARPPVRALRAPRRPSSSPTAPTPTLTPRNSKPCSARHRRSVGAGSRSRIATRSAPTAPQNGASPRNTCSSAANAAG